MRDDLKEMHVDIRAAIGAVMAGRELEDGPFMDAVIDISGILGEEIVVLMGSICDPAHRGKIVELFCKHLGPAVERAHIRGLAGLAAEQSIN